MKIQFLYLGISLCSELVFIYNMDVGVITYAKHVTTVINILCMCIIKGYHTSSMLYFCIEKSLNTIYMYVKLSDTMLTQSIYPLLALTVTNNCLASL